MIADDLHLAFEDLLCQYGADLRAWPADLVGPATRHLRRSYAARRHLNEMRRLERLLQADGGTTDPPDGLEERIIAGMMRLRESDRMQPQETGSGTSPSGQRAVVDAGDD